MRTMMVVLAVLALVGVGCDEDDLCMPVNDQTGVSNCAYRPCSSDSQCSDLMISVRPNFPEQVLPFLKPKCFMDTSHPDHDVFIPIADFGEPGVCLGTNCTSDAECEAAASMYDPASTGSERLAWRTKCFEGRCYHPVCIADSDCGDSAYWHCDLDPDRYELGLECRQRECGMGMGNCDGFCLDQEGVGVISGDCDQSSGLCSCTEYETRNPDWVPPTLPTER